MAIDLGPLQIDDDVVLRQLRLDLKDDWFRDPREYEDIFNSGQIKAVKFCFQESHGFLSQISTTSRHSSSFFI